jgi:iron(III) transport system substrate-binding protein
MTTHRTTMFAALFGIAVANLAVAPAAPAETLTNETRKLLKDLKLGEDVLDGLDAELAVPQAWIDGAKKEGVVKVRLPLEIQRFAGMAELFKARYPGIEVEYTRGTGPARAQQPLITFKRGTYLADVLSSWDPMEQEYRAADALIPLSDLPAFKSIPAAYNAEGNYGVGFRLQHWCIGYNTEKVKKSDLPKTWEDILTNPRWRGGKIGMARNVHVWLGTLWGSKGTAWVNNYIEKTFEVVKPQLRKENLRAYLKLMSIGEYDMAIPAGDFIIRTLEDDGMPITLHCPEPVPTNAGWIGIFKGNPHPNAAKLFANWMLSKEGQIAGYRADSNIPANKGLARGEFLPYPEEVLEHRLAVRTPAAQANVVNVVKEFNRYWIAGGAGERPR